MHSLSAKELLDVWEQGRDRPMPVRAVGLLAAACPESSVESLMQLPIGRRDGLLLSLREMAFGPELSAMAECPQCSERLEISFHADDVRPSGGSEQAGPFQFETQGYQLHLRPVNSTDLSRFTGTEPPETLRQELLECCLLDARFQGAPQGIGDLPEPVIVDAINRLERADPLASSQVQIACPSCGQASPVLFDIALYFWREIENWAFRLLRDVHALAAAYGWSERDILALSPWRRQYYLQMVQG
ncbi:hypothetical protein [Methyloterricola oryzae]|uniref:T4 family baseplate hub assembly chaperone n=1 Tax=Methyloterricola oryzae TaxID=1495050 RepID=UPI0005EBC129|nr:hypothetical protein [Methyloterricola oryzae]